MTLQPCAHALSTASLLVLLLPQLPAAAQQLAANSAGPPAPTTAPQASQQSGASGKNETMPGKSEPKKATKQQQDSDAGLPDHTKPLPALSPDARYDYQGEATGILQQLFRFHSPYEGPNSLASRNEAELTHTYTLFLGARLLKDLEVFVNPEAAFGNSFSNAGGLSGTTDGDLIGQNSLSKVPYIARAFLRWRVAMPHIGKHSGREMENEEQVGRAPNIIKGSIPAHRLTIQAGKFGVSDVFDTNAYANNPRSQFMNNALGNNLAYDYAQETRGYAYGIAISWVNPDWALRVGSFGMPTLPGGPNISGNILRSRGDQVEYDRNFAVLGGPRPPMTVRLLGFRSAATMGTYRDALAAAQASGMAPDVSAVRQTGAAKYGFGLNFDQALADGGNTGVFGRWGWNDGRTESFAYAECNRFLSFGGQLAGKSWGRADDRVGLGFAQSGISNSHRDYLAAGGSGFNLGDGKLNYGSEGLMEAYYAYQLTKALALTADYQYVNNPGYNRDRGPVNVFSVRAHLTF